MGAGKEGGGYWEHTTKGGRELFLEKRRKGRGIGKEGGGYWEHTTETDVPFFNVSYYEAPPPPSRYKSKLAMFKIATFKIAMFKIDTPILVLYWPVRVV